MTPAEVAETIAIASRLRVSTLYLSNRNIDTLPESIGELTDLTELHLENNQLTNLPESIGKLTNLTQLYLQSNQLTSLPESFGNFCNLIKLLSDDNRLIKLPASIGNLISLTTLNLCNNQLIGLPESIGNLSNLTLLNLSANQLTTLPASFSNLTNLDWLSLSDNSLIDLSILQKLSNLTMLDFLNIYLPRKYWVRFNSEIAKDLLSIDNHGIVRSFFIQSIESDNSEDFISNRVYFNYRCLPIELSGLEQMIAEARCNRSTNLDLQSYKLTRLPDSVSNFTDLVSLDLRNNELTNLPETIGDFPSLTKLFLNQNQLISLPDSICKLTKLTSLVLSYNQLTNLPEDIGNLYSLTNLYLNQNQLTSLPSSIGSLSNLTEIYLNDNPWVDLSNLQNIPNLKRVYCFGTDLRRRYWNKLSEWKAEYLLDESNNEIRRLLIEHVGYEKISAELSAVTLDTLQEYSLLIIDDIIETIADLSILKELPKLESVRFMGADLPHRYWTKFSEWKPEWLLDEDNTEIKRILIEQVGYEKICTELNATTLDTWREYTLLKIDGIQAVYEEYEDEPIDREPMVLLKMTCPSTAHIHILRVPPELESADAAITWVNHGIHPDDFAVQT